MNFHIIERMTLGRKNCFANFPFQKMEEKARNITWKTWTWPLDQVWRGTRKRVWKKTPGERCNNHSIRFPFPNQPNQVGFSHSKFEVCVCSSKLIDWFIWVANTSCLLPPKHLFLNIILLCLGLCNSNNINKHFAQRTRISCLLPSINPHPKHISLPSWWIHPFGVSIFCFSIQETCANNSYLWRDFLVRDLVILRSKQSQNASSQTVKLVILFVCVIGKDFKVIDRMLRSLQFGNFVTFFSVW